MNRQWLLLIALLFAGNLFAQNECKLFFPYEEGVAFEITHYDKKDRLSSVTYNEVDVIEETDQGLEIQMINVLKDDKGDEVSSGTYRMYCENGTIRTDVSSMLDPALTESVSSMEVEISGDGLLFPASLEVGAKLPDGFTEIVASSNGMRLMTLTFQVSDRKVEAKESITTPAGTFDCYRLSQQIETKVAFVKKSYRTVEWYAEGYGMVRQEMYDKKDKLEGYSELTMFKGK